MSIKNNSKEKIEKQLEIGFFTSSKTRNMVSFNPDHTSQNIIRHQDNHNRQWHIPITSNTDPLILVNEITSLIEKNYHKFGTWGTSFDNILNMMLYTLTFQEENYMITVQKLEKEAVYIVPKIFTSLLMAFCYDYNIFDYLGSIYMNIASISKSKYFGQYFTPFNVALLMAKMQLPDLQKVIKESKQRGTPITISDPTCGSGALLLAMKHYIISELGLAGLDHFKFYGQDIDYTCVKMCKIQMILSDYRYMTDFLYVRACELKDKLDEFNKRGINKK